MYLQRCQSALSGAARRSSLVITSSGSLKKKTRPSCSTLSQAGNIMAYLMCCSLSLRLASVNPCLRRWTSVEKSGNMAILEYLTFDIFCTQSAVKDLSSYLFLTQPKN